MINRKGAAKMAMGHNSRKKATPKRAASTMGTMNKNNRKTGAKTPSKTKPTRATTNTVTTARINFTSTGLSVS